METVCGIVPERVQKINLHAHKHTVINKIIFHLMINWYLRQLQLGTVP
jgi:hypothetical protein